jgi:hypothetical protein
MTTRRPDAGITTEEAENMGIYTDRFQELARSEMENRFREIINEAVRAGYLGNFNDVIVPALANVLLEQVASCEHPLQLAYLVSLQREFSKLLVALCERDGDLYGVPPIGASSDADPLPF